jgi:hypothetical protein
MMAITTSNSISVKPGERRAGVLDMGPFSFLRGSGNDRESGLKS